ncbi:hypothetical protein IAU60_006361 [Kwoniella sp. DSM 27419]
MSGAGPATPMTDYVGLLGPLDEWSGELSEGGLSQDKKAAARHLPAPRHGHTPDGYSWLAQRGAAQLLGCPARQYSPADLRTCVESLYDYWHGKLFTMRTQAMATAQLIQDELQFNVGDIPTQAGGNHLPQDSAFRETNAVLRPLTTGFTLYTYALEIKDAFDRLDTGTADEVASKEIEYIREVAGLMMEEVKLSLRLLWASGPGKHLVKLSLSVPWHESTNISRDIRLHLVKPLSDIAAENPFDARWAALCLDSSEAGPGRESPDFVRLLAFEQAAKGETFLGDKLPYALQMALGEWTMAVELLSELPPKPDRPIDPSGPKTMAVRLNVSRSAATQLCTAQPFVSSLCDYNAAMELSPQLWETLGTIQGIFAGELGLPPEAQQKLFPFMVDEQETPRWEPKDDKGVPLSSSQDHSSQVGKRKRPEFVVSQGDHRVWKDMMDHKQTEPVSPGEVFRVDRVHAIGGSFTRFAPPNNAGISWIMRLPMFDTWAGPGEFKIPLEGVAYNMEGSYGWTSDWFTTPEASDHLHRLMSRQADEMSTDRTKPRPLTLDELWVRWDKMIDEQWKENRLIMGQLGISSLPPDARECAILNNIMAGLKMLHQSGEGSTAEDKIYLCLLGMRASFPLEAIIFGMTAGSYKKAVHRFGYLTPQAHKALGMDGPARESYPFANARDRAEFFSITDSSLCGISIPRLQTTKPSWKT